MKRAQTVAQSTDVLVIYQDDVKRQQALEVLSLPDAIMEPDVLKTVNEFAQSGGNINQALERVTASYIGTRWLEYVHSAPPFHIDAGYAQMAHLVCQWLEETPLAPPEGSADTPASSSANEATFLRVRMAVMPHAVPANPPSGVYQRPL